MKSALIVFPHQLFDGHPGLRRDVSIFLVEDQLFFDDYKYPIPFHTHKLILHRSTLNRYYRKLISQGYHVTYINYEKSADMSYLFKQLIKEEIDEITFCELIDFELERRIRKECDRYCIKMKEIDSPAFLISKDKIHSFFKEEDKYSLGKFYITQRKHLNLLLEKNRPIGGKWNFDNLTWKKIPSSLTIPNISRFCNNVYIEEAKEYIGMNFPHNPHGELEFFYPVTSTDLNKWLEDFFKKRFIHFGSYLDSADKENSFLFHSIISYALNIGLVTPKAVIDMAIEVSKEYAIPINSLERFIRQIAGCREYIRTVYVLNGVEERTKNFWGFTDKMPKQFYDGTTGIEPIDHLIHRVNDLAYLNNIERLMFIGNFMLLCEISPDEVYKWYMAKFIDSYDWVIVPNVYGISQFADGGLISNKPHISSSNYILKTSNFKKGAWCEIWDALYWRFIYKHKKYFMGKATLTMITSCLDEKEDLVLKRELKIAEDFLLNLRNMG
jgi:deoxyribodipyrimidine photolyase-related protein